MKKILVILFLLISSFCYSQVRQTFGAVADNLDSLFTHVGKQNQYVLVLGRFNAYDSLGGVYAYDSNSTATEIPYVIFKVIGKDTGRWKAVYFFNSSEAERFGIEDNLGLQDRSIDMQAKNLHIYNLNTLDIISGDSTLTNKGFQIYGTPTSGSMYIQDDGGINQSSINLAPSALSITSQLTDFSQSGNIYVKPNEIYIERIYGAGTQKQTFSSPTTGDYFIPLTVNGNAADATGNISVSAASGGIGAVYAGVGLTKINDSTLAADTTTVLSTKAHVTDVLQGYVPTTRTISTTSPLSGGGDLSANRTLSLGVVPIANGGTNNGSLSVTAGTVYYGDGTKLIGLAPGTAAQVLHSGTTPSWKDTTSAGGTAFPLTFNNGGAGDASGTTFDGSTARTLSYNSIGAVPTTRTVNGKALSANITLGLASSDFANQGTTTTVLHGNASGNPSFSAVSLTADVTGVLPIANGGTNNGSLSVTNQNLVITDGSKQIGLAKGGNGMHLITNGSGNLAWVDTSANVSFSGLANRLPRWSSTTNIAYMDSVFLDNSTTSIPRIGFGTNTPTSTITLDSARSSNSGSTFANGITMFSTRDQTTNYSGFNIGHSTVGFYVLKSIKGGTGVLRAIGFNGTTTYATADGLGLQTNTVNATTVTTTTVQASTFSPNTLTTLNFVAGSSAASGATIAHDFRSQVSESGSAGRTILRIAPNFTSTGSGTYNLIEIGENSNSSGTGAQTNQLVISKAGKFTYAATNTAAGTTGDQTINKPSGTVNFAATATALTVTNSLCTTSSIIFCTVRTNDATSQIKNVVPGSGSFVITLNAAATAETSVGFLIIN